jgi:hypothetical protein
MKSLPMVLRLTSGSRPPPARRGKGRSHRHGSAACCSGRGTWSRPARPRPGAEARGRRRRRSAGRRSPRGSARPRPRNQRRPTARRSPSHRRPARGSSDRFLAVGAHRPVALEPGELDEVLVQLPALGGVVHLGVELDGVEMPLGVGGDGEGRVGRGAKTWKPGASFDTWSPWLIQTCSRAWGPSSGGNQPARMGCVRSVGVTKARRIRPCRGRLRHGRPGNASSPAGRSRSPGSARPSRTRPFGGIGAFSQ